MTLLYAALGDSMSIDIYAGGAGRGATSLLHTNRDADFPNWAGRDLASRGYELLDLTADRRLWYCGVIEPNAWGAHEIRCTWWRAVEQAGWLS